MLFATEMLSELVIICIIGGIFFYRWATKNNDFFKERNIAYDNPAFLLGSGKDMTLRRKTMYEVFADLYQKHDGM